MIPTSHNEQGRLAHYVGGAAPFLGNVAQNCDHCSKRYHLQDSKTEFKRTGSDHQPHCDAMVEQQSATVPKYSVLESAPLRRHTYDLNPSFSIRPQAGEHPHQPAEKKSPGRKREENDKEEKPNSSSLFLQTNRLPKRISSAGESQETSFQPVVHESEPRNKMRTRYVQSRGGPTVEYSPLSCISLLSSVGSTPRPPDTTASYATAMMATSQDSAKRPLREFARVFVEHNYRDHAFEEYAFNHITQLVDDCNHEEKRFRRLSSEELSETLEAKPVPLVFPPNFPIHELAVKSCGTVENDRNCLSFPEKLYELLSVSSDDGRLSSVISWQQHGRCFLVRKPENFVKDVLPRYFRQSKLTSFQRQLNMYGFKRLTRQCPDRGAYYHEFFLRGRPSLCRYIVRCRIKGNKIKPVPNPAMEPNFHMMRPCHDDDWKIFFSAKPSKSVSSNGARDPAEGKGSGVVQQNDGLPYMRRSEHVSGHLDQNGFNSSRSLLAHFDMPGIKENDRDICTNLKTRPPKDKTIPCYSELKVLDDLSGLYLQLEKPDKSFTNGPPEATFTFASSSTASSSRSATSTECCPLAATNQSTLTSFSFDAATQSVLSGTPPREGMSRDLPSSSSGGMEVLSNGGTSTIATSSRRYLEATEHHPENTSLLELLIPSSLALLDSNPIRLPREHNHPGISTHNHLEYSQHDDWQDLGGSLHVNNEEHQSELLNKATNKEETSAVKKFKNDDDPLMDEEVDSVDPDLLRSFESVVFATASDQGNDKANVEDSQWTEN